MLLAISVMAQQYSNLRQKTIFVSDSVLLDSLSMVPGSEIIRNQQNEIMADSVYRINYSKSIFYFETIQYRNQNLSISYRVFPFNFSKPYPEHPIIPNDSLILNPDNYLIFGGTESNPANSESKLLINGNISRGIMVGNAQNTSVNSNLNLQLSGELSDGLFIEANISDKNVPVQPNGYSQQIQEFDQVFVRIYDSIRSLQMGDVDISAKNSHFLKFNRRILGGDFNQQTIPISNNTKASTQVSAAVSKGSFNRTEFLGIEAVQGPYLLQGAHNETYIVIIAGTEKIYLDGILLERGENADYVMNYNTAELTFTPKHFITKNSRIIAEFEYSDKNYNRFLLYTQNQVKHKNKSYTIQYFTEGDAKNQPVNQLLTNEHKQVLADAGNDRFKAVVPNIDSVGFDKNRVLYKMADTLVNGIFYDSILVYSVDPLQAIYHAGFTLVGENSGNYIHDITPANGKVFKWVAPVNGVRQGNYEPVQLLIAPQKQQMVIAKTEIEINERTNALVELAFSEKNSNTFSPSSTTNNTGWAVKNSLAHSIPLDKKSLNLNITYEWANKNFTPVERYRNAEFNRDWNLNTPFFHDEHFLSAGINLVKQKTAQTSFSSSYLNYGTLYHAYLNTFTTNINWLKFNFTGKASLLNAETVSDQSQFYRHYLKLSRPVWKIKLGAKHDFENNLQKNSSTDSLLLKSKKYSVAETFISSNDSATNLFYLGYANRVDFMPIQNYFTPATESNDIIFNTRWNGSANQNLKTSVVWRNLKVRNEAIETSQENEQNLLGQIDHQIKLKDNLINLFTFYEMSTGLENRKEFSYIEVAPGQGIYVWIDYNNDGIPELNEFEVSPFPEEANYLRIYTPTSDYIKVYSLKLNETFKIDPSKIWRNSNGIKKIISRFSNTLTFRASHKHKQSDIVSRINPFPAFVNDTLQITRNVSFRNTFSFNRSHPTFGADYDYNTQNQKSLITTGFDASKFESHQLKIRWNILSSLSLFNQSEWQIRTYISEYFTNKNYEIEFAGNEITMQWQPTNRFRTSVIYKIKNKTNLIGIEKALMHEAGPEIKINSPTKGSLSVKFLVVFNEYSGALNGPVAYTMLEGYQPGENYRWNINFSRNINKFLRMNLSYNGRKSADNPIIHTGQFSLSAYF